MTAAERNYVVTEQELLATVEALHVFRCYLLSGEQFNMVTDIRTKHISADSANLVATSSSLE